MLTGDATLWVCRHIGKQGSGQTGINHNKIKSWNLNVLADHWGWLSPLMARQTVLLTSGNQAVGVCFFPHCQSITHWKRLLSIRQSHCHNAGLRENLQSDGQASAALIPHPA
jgi:hypothetical protein